MKTTGLALDFAAVKYQGGWVGLGELELRIFNRALTTVVLLFWGLNNIS
jgi:hypothetical protein